MAQKILIVDDDPVARHIAHTVLKANGYVTTVASDAMGALAETQQLIVEGSGAVGVAALLSRKIDLSGKQVAVVISGGNIEPKLLEKITGNSAVNFVSR